MLMPGRLGDADTVPENREGGSQKAPGDGLLCPPQLSHGQARVRERGAPALALTLLGVDGAKPPLPGPKEG